MSFSDYSFFISFKFIFVYFTIDFQILFCETTNTPFFFSAGPVPLSVYQRLKKLEDRILELEGISPEYFQSTVSTLSLSEEISGKGIQENLHTARNYTGRLDFEFWSKDLDHLNFKLAKELLQNEAK